MPEVLDRILSQLNVPCADDGSRFTVSERVDNLRALLAGSRYRAARDAGVSLVYAHGSFDPARGLVVVSSHVDALYGRYFAEEFDDEQLLGTFDNSLGDAILAELMLRDALPPNALAAFTGDEEENSRGAEEVARWLKGEFLADQTALVVTLDVTAEGYGFYGFTAENLFLREPQAEEASLRFRNRKSYIQYVLRKLRGGDILTIPDAAPDDSYRYLPQGFNTLSLCIPSKAHPDEPSGNWMHSDRGILVEKRSIPEFSDRLKVFCEGVCDDLSS